jgi:enamine deaminase RidA (YjgF/YER057c/UK114 family)
MQLPLRRTLSAGGCPGAQTMKLVGDGVEEQAEQVMCNMEAILAAAGCTFADVMKTTILCAPPRGGRRCTRF